MGVASHQLAVPPGIREGGARRGGGIWTALSRATSACNSFVNRYRDCSLPVERSQGTAHVPYVEAGKRLGGYGPAAGISSRTAWSSSRNRKIAIPSVQRTELGQAHHRVPSPAGGLLLPWVERVGCCRQYSACRCNPSPLRGCSDSGEGQPRYQPWQGQAPLVAGRIIRKPGCGSIGTTTIHVDLAGRRGSQRALRQSRLPRIISWSAHR